jgi:hypothetical protein
MAGENDRESFALAGWLKRSVIRAARRRIARKRSQTEARLVEEAEKNSAEYRFQGVSSKEMRSAARTFATEFWDPMIKQMDLREIGSWSEFMKTLDDKGHVLRRKVREELLLSDVQRELSSGQLQLYLNANREVVIAAPE